MILSFEKLLLFLSDLMQDNISASVMAEFSNSLSSDRSVFSLSDGVSSLSLS